MKLNKLYTAVSFVVMAMLFGCSEYEDTVTPSPEVSSSNPEVRFDPENATSYELDPSVSTEFTLTVLRSDASSAIEAPIEVITNDDDSFVFPDAVSFAAGDLTSTITVQMADGAEAGTELSFAITFDEDYINPYLADAYPSFYGTASIIKWNSLGTVQFYDSFTFYKVAEVTLEQRDDVPSMYRISYPYSEGILLDAEWDGWLGGTTQNKITFTVAEDGSVTWGDFWYTSLLYQGTAGDDIKAYETEALGKEVTDASVAVYDGDNISYLDLHPYFYIDGVGGWGEYSVYVGFPGFDLAGALGLPVYSE